MDRLSEDLKRTMQVASVIGRDFAFRILKMIMELGEEMRTHLNNLVGLEILYEKALYPELEYIFKHALTQEVAYNSLLKERRKKIHDRIALAIEELYSDRLEEHYELLAHHYERSGNVEKAIDYLILAGEKSILSCAVQAASEFFDRALEVAKSNDLVLDASAAIRLYRARGQASFGIGSVGKSVEDSKKTMELSRIHGMIDYEKESLYHVAATTYLWPVKVEAEQFLEEGIARARELEDKALESCILTHKGLLAAMYGQPYEGGQMMLDAGRMAKETGDPKSMFITRYYRSYAERWLGRPRRSIELTEGMHQMMREMWNVSRVPYVISNRGTALAEIGRVDEAIKIVRDGIAFCEQLGIFVRLGCLYNTLGYCYSEIHHAEIARELNLKGEEIAREMKGKYPMGRRQYAEMIAQSSVNVMENLFDQRETDAAWNRLKALDEEAKSEDFDMLRHRWESRMNYLAAQIHLQRNDLDQAEIVIQPGLEKARKEHHKKREASFLRLLGEISIKRGESDKAIENISEAIPILQEVGNPRQLWQAHASLASAYDKIGRSSEARDQWGAAAEVIGNVVNGLADRDLREGFLRAKPIRVILSNLER
jgi:tetratricopeptide (TPR) repeat protein